MYFNSKEFILGVFICTGILGINHAYPHNMSDIIITERNCTHVTFAFDVQFLSSGPISAESSIQVNGSDNIVVSDFGLDYSSYFAFRLRGRCSFCQSYIAIRADPIPKTWRDMLTIYHTFRFPNEFDEYHILTYGLLEQSEESEPSMKVRKSRCPSQDDITGCNPYCVCDTVVQTTCPNGQSIRGKCTDSGSLTESSASYIFNEACPQVTGSRTDSSLKTSASVPSSSGPFSSTASSSGPFSSKPSSSAASKTIGIVLGAIVAVMAITGFVLYRKKKKGGRAIFSDE